MLQARVPIQTGDTAERLAARVLEKEHLIYPLAAQWLLQGRLALTDNGATLDGNAIPATGIDYRPELA